ncbi:2493_t:CDS:2, partial [Paraglomus occultum]
SALVLFVLVVILLIACCPCLACVLRKIPTYSDVKQLLCYWTDGAPAAPENKTPALDYQVIPEQRSVTVDEGNVFRFNDENDTIVRLKSSFPIPQLPTANNESPNLDSVAVQMSEDTTAPSGTGENSHVCISVDNESNNASYFEVTVLSNRENTVMTIGLTINPQQSSEGENEHFVYCSDGSTHGPNTNWGVNDTVGCGYDCNTGCVYFTKNGRRLNIDSKVPSQDTRFPTIRATGPCSVKVNFGVDKNMEAVEKEDENS